MKTNVKLLFILFTLLVSTAKLVSIPPKADPRAEARRARLQATLAARTSAAGCEDGRPTVVYPEDLTQHRDLMNCWVKGLQQLFLSDGTMARRLSAAFPTGVRCRDWQHFDQNVQAALHGTPGCSGMLELMERLIVGIAQQAGIPITPSTASAGASPALVRHIAQVNRLKRLSTEEMVIELLIKLGMAPQATPDAEAEAAGTIDSLPIGLRQCVGKGRVLSAQKAFQSLVLTHSVLAALRLLSALEDGEPFCCSICLEPLLVKPEGEEEFSFPSFSLPHSVSVNPASIVLPFACNNGGPLRLAHAKHAVHLKCAKGLQVCPICRCEARS